MYNQCKEIKKLKLVSLLLKIRFKLEEELLMLNGLTEENYEM